MGATAATAAAAPPRQLPHGGRRYDPAMVVMPLRGTFLALGQVALGVVAVCVALVLIGGPSGSARVVGIIAAVVVLGGAAWLIRGLRRQAIIVDGSRLGWRGGPTGRIAGWTDLADVEVASVAHVSSTINRAHVDVILWTPVGGLTGIRAVLLQRQFPASLRSAPGPHGPSGAELHPFIVPFTAFGDADRATMRQMLDERGLLPG